MRNHSGRCRTRHLLFVLTSLALALASCNRNTTPANSSGDSGSGTAGASPAGAFRPYGVRHAIIHLKVSGNARGYQVIVFDSFGYVETHDINSESFSSEGFRPIKTYSVKRGADVTIIDSFKHTGQHFIDHKLDSLYHLTGSDVPTFDTWFRQNFTDVGYFRAGDTVIQGLNVHIWRQGHMPFQLYEWKGIVIGRQANIDYGSNLDVVSVDTTSPIDPKWFVVPSGFPIQNRTAEPAE